MNWNELDGVSKAYTDYRIAGLTFSGGGSGGSAGSSGSSGSSGTSGVSGSSGSSGTSGVSGSSGSSGTSGVSGSSGSSGTSGVSGSSGSSGVSGSTGSSGSSGTSGLSGLSPSNYVVRGVKNGSSQTIPNGSDTVISFVDDYDPQNWLSSNKIQPNIAGYYNLNTQVWWNAGSVANNQTNIQFRKNGSTQVVIQQTQILTGSGYGQELSATIYLNGSTDYIEITAYTGNPTSQDINGSANGTWFEASLVVGGSGSSGSSGVSGSSGSSGTSGYAPLYASVYSVSTGSATSANNTWTKINSTTTVQNIGGLTASSGRITNNSGSTKTFLVNTSTTGVVSSLSSVIRFSVSVSAAAPASYIAFNPGANSASALSYVNISTSNIVRLNNNDYIEPYFYVVGSSATYTCYTLQMTATTLD